jgi:CBS domain-containing protein
MMVKEVMTQDFAVVPSQTTLRDAADEMRRFNVGMLPVVDTGTLVGTITDRDITVRATADGQDPNRTTVASIMQRDVYHCDESDDISEARRLMEEHRIHRVIVLNSEQQLAGILSVDDLARRAGSACLAGEILERVANERAP